MTRLGWDPSDPLPGEGEDRFMPGDPDPYGEIGGLQLVAEGYYGDFGSKVDWGIYGCRYGEYVWIDAQPASSAIEALHRALRDTRVVDAGWLHAGARFFVLKSKGPGFFFALAEREPPTLKKTPFDRLNFAIVTFLRETSDPDRASLPAWAQARQGLMRHHSEAWKDNEKLLDETLTPRERQIRLLGGG